MFIHIENHRMREGGTPTREEIVAQLSLLTKSGVQLPLV